VDDRSRVNLLSNVIRLHASSKKTTTGDPAPGLAAPLAPDTEPAEGSVEQNLRDSALQNYALTKGFINPEDLTNEKSRTDAGIAQARAIHEARTGLTVNPIHDVAHALDDIRAKLGEVLDKVSDIHHAATQSRNRRVEIGERNTSAAPDRREPSHIVPTMDPQFNESF